MYYVISGTNNLKVIGVTDRSITEIVIPATVECNGTIYNVTSIGNDAFYGCSNLAEVTIPENINISYDAFYNAGVPATVTIDGLTYDASPHPEIFFWFNYFPYR